MNLQRKDRTAAGRTGRKGIFAIVTAFFVIIAVVVAVIGFFLVYQVIYRTGAAQTADEQSFATAQLFRTRLFQCQDGTLLSEEKLEQNACGIVDGVSGYAVIQEARFGCTAKNWTYGVTDDRTAAHTYWVNVRQRGGKTCLARLRIHQ